MSLPCNTCRIKFASREELLAHYKTELHRANLKLQSQHIPPLTQEQFDQLKAEEAAKAEPVPAQHPEEEEDESEFDPRLCRDIPPTECLFCGKTFENEELAFAHMADHGFRFCYPDKLKDPAGLMHYFGEKVGVGHCCINCSRQFNSMQAVRDHMRDKRHCAYEFDEELEEFYEPETGIVPVQYEVDEVGELHVNGKVYGHRMYMRYYKQRPTDPEELKKMARIPIAGPTAPRESITLEGDAIARKREFYRQKYISKRERRVATKLYHPMSDIHRGNA